MIRSIICHLMKMFAPSSVSLLSKTSQHECKLNTWTISWNPRNSIIHKQNARKSIINHYHLLALLLRRLWQTGIHIHRISATYDPRGHETLLDIKWCVVTTVDVSIERCGGRRGGERDVGSGREEGARGRGDEVCGCKVENLGVGVTCFLRSASFSAQFSIVGNATDVSNKNVVARRKTTTFAAKVWVVESDVVRIWVVGESVVRVFGKSCVVFRDRDESDWVRRGEGLWFDYDDLLGGSWLFGWRECIG